jgi:uncharacterized protein YndB with AHSA1/START domain
MTKTMTRKMTLERTYQAPIEHVWELWTTKEGIESWWGPEGFTVQVNKMDLRPGGRLEYAMTATGPEQIAFMQKANMPLTTQTRLTYTEVVPMKRLAYETIADFVPGVEPYNVSTVVELEATAKGVRMMLTFDAMHDEQWTKMAVMGRESELRKLAGVLGQKNG